MLVEGALLDRETEGVSIDEDGNAVYSLGVVAIDGGSPPRNTGTSVSRDIHYSLAAVTMNKW